MKFLHLADLHIGKRVNEFSMIEDQRYILTELLGVIDEQKVEAVLIAGDVYDKVVPSAEAVTLLSEFLGKLAKRNLQVFVISGNHDSAERIAFGSELMSISGVHMAKPFSGVPECHKIKDEFGNINIYMLPFIKPAYVRNFYAEEEINSYEDAVKVVMEHTEINKEERNILIAHQFVKGASTCESEEIAVGGLDEVGASNFEQFDYVALGHLHGPQKVVKDYIRYAGTLLKYSFSEVAHKKGALILDIREKGDIEITNIPIKPLHDMREIAGKYEEIVEQDFYMDFSVDDYLHITLTDEEDVPNAMGRLRTVYPNIMKLDYNNARTRATKEITADIDVERKTPFQLFEEFYELQNNQEMSEEQRTFVTELMESIWEEK